MKYFIAILLSALLSTSTFAQTLSPEEFPPVVTYFLQECSGVNLTPPIRPEGFEAVPEEMTKGDKMERMMAYLTCMTYTRGVVESHAVTIQKYVDQRIDYIVQDYESKNDVRIPPINFGYWWCIDKKISDHELMLSVLGWVATNEKRMGEIDESLALSSNFRMVILITALQESFPCK